MRMQMPPQVLRMLLTTKRIRVQHTHTPGAGRGGGGRSQEERIKECRVVGSEGGKQGVKDGRRCKDGGSESHGAEVKSDAGMQG